MMRLPWDNWDSYESGLQEHPILTKTAINVGIYLIGDWLSQVCSLIASRSIVDIWHDCFDCPVMLALNDVSGRGADPPAALM